MDQKRFPSDFCTGLRPSVYTCVLTCDVSRELHVDLRMSYRQPVKNVLEKYETNVNDLFVHV